ncbi:MAG TPA: copper resistance protein NlpE N-terminal domain-containing protein [Catalimonadaceae bacterium]|nr:copper resistance protein NlpE N-terminal domain-containing protein [Catalimonadaceae bacterium]
MKSLIPLLTTIVFVFVLSSCSEEPSGKAVVTTGKTGFVEIPDWIGTFQDTLACNDCKGILTWLDIHLDKSYKKSIVYLGKEPILDNTFGTNGRWNFDSKTNVIWLDEKVEGRKMGFFVSSDSLLVVTDDKGIPIVSRKNQLLRISDRVLK